MPGKIFGTSSLDSGLIRMSADGTSPSSARSGGVKIFHQTVGHDPENRGLGTFCPRVALDLLVSLAYISHVGPNHDKRGEITRLRRGLNMKESKSEKGSAAKPTSKKSSKKSGNKAIPPSSKSRSAPVIADSAPKNYKPRGHGYGGVKSPPKPKPTNPTEEKGK